MDTSTLQESIAYCGLVCGLCDHIRDCTCRGPIKLGDKCDKEHCPHRKCCREHDYDGCWECSLFPCNMGRFADENRGQMLGFLQYIKEFGKEKFIDRLLLNQKKEIAYGMGGAYRLKNLDEINHLLRDED